MGIIIKGFKKYAHYVSEAGVLGWLIGINAAVFFILRLLAASYIFTGDSWPETTALSLLELPADLSQLGSVPWTVVTYMFTQFDVFHFVFNVLWLYWFGRLFLDCGSSRQLWRLYVGGGLAGAFLFIVSSLLCSGISQEARLVGSSASVLAIVAATAVMMPDRKIGLMFVGWVRLKWIALVMITFDFINMGLDNAGGHLAHIGGALVGVVFALYMKRKPVSRSSATVAPQLSDGQQIDVILDKIRRSGYNSLTRSERMTLFDISKRMK